MQDAAASLAVASSAKSELQADAVDLASTIEGLREAKADLLHCLDEKITESRMLSEQVLQLAAQSEELRAQLDKAESNSQHVQASLEQASVLCGQRSG